MTLAEDVVTFDQHIAEMDADPPLHAALADDGGVPLCRRLLQPQGALDGADHRAELDQHAIANCFDDPSAMLGDERGDGGAMLA